MCDAGSWSASLLGFNGSVASSSVGNTTPRTSSASYSSLASLSSSGDFEIGSSHSGRQHARFGVNPSHFVAFGDALIWSLEQQFGPEFTPELREAWITLYNAVRSEMIRAAQHAA